MEEKTTVEVPVSIEATVETETPLVAPGITRKEFNRFLRAKKVGPCPCCGENVWMNATSVDGQFHAFPIYASTNGRFSIQEPLPVKTTPVVQRICQNCHAIFSFSALLVGKWLANNPPEAEQ